MKWAVRPGRRGVALGLKETHLTGHPCYILKTEAYQTYAINRNSTSANTEGLALGSYRQREKKRKKARPLLGTPRQRVSPPLSCSQEPKCPRSVTCKVLQQCVSHRRLRATIRRHGPTSRPISHSHRIRFSKYTDERKAVVENKGCCGG